MFQRVNCDNRRLSHWQRVGMGGSVVVVRSVGGIVEKG